MSTGVALFLALVSLAYRDAQHVMQVVRRRSKKPSKCEAFRSCGRRRGSFVVVEAENLDVAPD
jgi:hypothetical protein